MYFYANPPTVNLIFTLKKYILLFFVLFITTSAVAQGGYNYYKYGVGIGLGGSYERAFTDIPLQHSHFSFNANLTYNISPFIPLELEFQKGKFSGGGLTADKDPLGRQYTNNYTSLIVHMDLQVGAIINYQDNRSLNILKNFYLGSGIGLIKNSNAVQRTNVILTNGSLDYVLPGSDKSTDIMIPLRFGYEFKIFNRYDEPGAAFDVGYTRTIVFGQGLDGYDDPTKYSNNTTEQYQQFTVSFKYFIGRLTAYNKKIRGSHK